MSIASRSKRIILSLGLAAIVGTTLVSNASAFGGFGFGGGGFGIGFGMGGRQAGYDHPGRWVRPLPVYPVYRPYYPVVRPVVTVRRVYKIAPVAVQVAPKPVVTGRSIGCTTPVSTTPAKPDPQFVFVVFQNNASAVDTAGFLKTYNVLVEDGPNQDGYFKLKLENPLSQDQISSMIDSMRTQTNVISEVTSGS